MAPPNPLDPKLQNPELELSTNQDGQDIKAETSKNSSPTSVFMNSEPMREEQVQNAMKFLSHPKVRGSPVIYRRSFLEKKGLTKEEIDEAFRRVPDPSPSAQASNVNEDGLVKPSTNVKSQAQIQTLQPAVAAPTTGVISSTGPLSRYRFHWSHAFLAIGVLAASGAGTAIIFKNTIVPRFRSWIRKIISEEEQVLADGTDSTPNVVEEAAAAAKATAAASADVAKATQEMLVTRNEENRYFKEFMNLLELQMQEMKSMNKTIQKLEEKNNFVYQEYHRLSVPTSKQYNMNGREDVDLRSVRSSSPPTYMDSSVAPHSKSYMDQPWEVSQVQYNPTQVLQSQVSGGRSNGKLVENVYQSNGNSSVPWWQQKNDRITELENEAELKSGSYSAVTTEKPSYVQRNWVPPQPPPVAIPEAAEAIRRPKPSVQKEQLASDQSFSSPSNETDELQKITQISESGGAVEINGSDSTRLNSSLIQEEHEHSLEGN